MALTPDQAKKKANELYKRLVPRAHEAVELQEFYEGRQPLVYASEKWQESHRARYKDFSDNWCETVANAPVEREKVIGFHLDVDTAGQSDTERKLYDEWLRNEQDSQSTQGFLGATVARRAFCDVWGDDRGKPIITWRPAHQAIVDYDAETGRKRKASLVIWDDIDDGYEYATLKTTDEVWKFRRQRLMRATEESRFVVPAAVIMAEGGGWELLKEDFYGTNRLGVVPVVELPNRPVLGGQPLSDIKGTIAMQNAINLLWAYLFNAADYASMPARVVMGQEPPKLPVLDANGQKIGEVPVDQKALTEGRMLWLTGKDTKIGQWESAKLDVFTDVIERAVRHIAAQTRTPQHYLLSGSGVSNLSAEAMVGLEAGLVQKVEQARDFFSPRIRDIFELIALQLGDDAAAEQAKLGEVQWADANNRSDAQMADAMLKESQAGYPFEWLLKQRGHSPREIQAIMEMRRKEMADSLGVGVQAAVQDTMNVGTV